MPLVIGSPIPKQLKKHSNTDPLWKGPEASGPQGGITFSLLSRFLACRERFRIHAVEGLQTGGSWNHKMGYGEMWHLCEEAHASEVSHFGEHVGTTLMDDNLREHCTKLCKQYKFEQEKIEKWYNVCKIQFPEYVKFWAEHPDVLDRTPLVQEKAFDVPYKLPSGRVVRLRGKWDSVDLIGTGKDTGIYLQENKTKGDIDSLLLQRQLSFDLQTMLYLTALQRARSLWNTSIETCKEGSQDLGWIAPIEHELMMHPLRGVRYNVVRRPLSGGKGTIVQHKPSKSKPQGESKEEYYDRLRQYIVEEPETYFMRWKVDVSENDLAVFRRDSLDSILEQLCVWYDIITNPKALVAISPWNMKTFMHWRHPFGIYNPMNEGGASDLDEYLATGSEIGLVRVDTVFPELPSVE